METGAPAAGSRAPAASQAVAWGPPLLLVFVITLFIPGTFQAGPIVLSPYKLVLVAAAIPLGLRWIRGQAGRVVAADVLMLLFCLWQALSIVLLHGYGRIPFIGSGFVEFFGAYLAGRVLVRSAADYRFFFKVFLGCLLVLLPFAVVELVLGKRLLANLFGKVFTVPEFNVRARLGLRRAALGFAHPIHLGVICSLAVANVYYIYRDRFLKSLRVTGFVLLMLFFSLSSAPMLAAALQLTMIGWDRILRFIRGHWVIGVFLGLIALALLQLLLPGGIVGYLVNEVIFSSYAGNNRIAIFQYGTAEVLRHPLLGIGLNEWVRPYWQHGTVDNFWLLMAMRHGLPALLLLVLAIGVSAMRIMSQPGLGEELSRYRTGYLIALAGLVVVLGTVHVWQNAAVFVMLYIGLGVWLYNGVEAAEIDARPRRARLPRTVARRPGPALTRGGAGSAGEGAAGRIRRRPARAAAPRRRGVHGSDDAPSRLR